MSRIDIVRGTTKNLAMQLVDRQGSPVPLSKLQGASAELLVRVQPTDLTNVLRFSTKDTPSSLLFEAAAPVLDINFAPGDTSGLSIQFYFWQLEVTLSDGTLLDVSPWDVFDVNLGGSAQPSPPVFTNTVKIDQDFRLPNDLAYIAPDGTPIQDAQIRVYLKSDYDAGNLNTPVGITTTNAFGGWRNPILVVTGFTYTARFEKPYEWGPNTKEFFA